MRLAEPRQYLALGGVDADARPDIRPVAVDLAARSALADVAQRVTPVPKAHAVRAVQVVPLRLPFAVAVEHLDAVVLAIGDIEPALGVAADIVRDVELAGVGAGLAPGAQEFAVDGEFVDAGVAVAVRDVEMLALRRQCRVGATME